MTTSRSRVTMRTLNATRPNVGLAVDYQRRLRALVAEMSASVEYWLRSSYRANTPRIVAAVAQDASPAVELQRAVRRLGRRWQKRFDDFGKAEARRFARRAARLTDAQMAAELKRIGFTVGFKATPAMNDALQSVIGEQVSLISSLPAQHMTQVEGAVMRAVQSGRDLATLARELEHQHGVTDRRAAFIARDQVNKATAVFTRARQAELGITEAIWLHSAGGKKPRPEHVAFSGKRYDIAKGAFLEGKWTWPGVEPRCRCVSKSIVPGF